MRAWSRSGARSATPRASLPASSAPSTATSRRRTDTRSRTRSRRTPPINHGNSGGPLIDSSGKVVGTNVQIAVGDQNGGSANAGVGFAVPSNTVKTVADDLIAGKAVEHAYLGVAVGDSLREAAHRSEPFGPEARRRPQASRWATSSPPSTARRSRTPPSSRRPSPSIGPERRCVSPSRGMDPRSSCRPSSRRDPRRRRPELHSRRRARVSSSRTTRAATRDARPSLASRVTRSAPTLLTCAATT